MFRFGLAPVEIRGPRPVPLLGARGNLVRFFADPAGRMLALRRDFGAIAAVADRDPALVLAFGAPLNHAVLTRPELFEHGSEVPVRAPPGSALARFNRVLPFMNGEAHRARRRLMQPAFLRAAVDGYAPTVAAVVEAALDTWPIGQPLDLAARVRELSAAVALRCLFGVAPDDLGGDLAGLELELLRALSSPLALALPLPIPGTPYRRAVTLAARVEARLRAVIAAKRARPPGAGDVLSLLLPALDDETLVGECNGLFVAGHDTTAETLAWTLLLLMQHPRVLRDLQGDPEGPLLDRVLKESMRLLPAAPMLFLRVCAREAPLGPHTLPAGACVVLSPLVTHRDPDVFPAPARFAPDRWEALDPSPWSYLPFGAGPRMCLGAQLGAQLQRWILPRILRRFTPQLAPGARVDRGMHGITMAPRRGLPALLRPATEAPGPPAALRGDIRELVELTA